MDIRPPLDPNPAQSQPVERARPRWPAARYVKAAMQQATYQPGPDGHSFAGIIAGLAGVTAQARTVEECRAELCAVLETWLLLRLCQQQPVPAIAGVPFRSWVGIKQGC
jgi:predicted RNase H-like HicB family nuclease